MTGPFAPLMIEHLGAVTLCVAALVVLMSASLLWILFRMRKELHA